MNEIESNPLYSFFLQWLENNVAADENGQRKVSTAQLWEFLDAHVFNDATTVAVDGAEISLLWSFLIGSVSTNDLSKDLATRSNLPIRYIGNTLAGEFFAFLDSADGERYLSFNRDASVVTPDSDVLTQERAFNQYWHKLSQFYVENTDGALVTLTPNGSITTIFSEDEIPALIENESIDVINGVERSEIGIEIFSSGSKAQLYYLLAVLNGEFAGDLLRSGTARVVQTNENGNQAFHLDIDAQTLAYLGMQGASLGFIGGAQSVVTDMDAVRADLLPAHVRGLHVALFGPVMREDGDGFIDFIGRDGRAESLPDEKDFKGSSADFIVLQTAIEGFVESIWAIAQTADVSTLLSIARLKQLRDDENIDAMADYFELLLKYVEPYIDAAPEELKRDLTSATRQLQRTMFNTIAGVPQEAQRRLAVTTGGRSLYLLDQWRGEVLDPSSPLEPLIEGVGIYSKSETDLGDAFYVTLGASSGYAVIRRSIETILESLTGPTRFVVEQLVKHFDAFDDVGKTIFELIERVRKGVDGELDSAGNLFRCSPSAPMAQI